MIAAMATVSGHADAVTWISAPLCRVPAWHHHHDAVEEHRDHARGAADDREAMLARATAALKMPFADEPAVGGSRWSDNRHTVISDRPGWLYLSPA
jgi:hypothetical protein